VALKPKKREALLELLRQQPDVTIGQARRRLGPISDSYFHHTRKDVAANGPPAANPLAAMPELPALNSPPAAPESATADRRRNARDDFERFLNLAADVGGVRNVRAVVDSVNNMGADAFRRCLAAAECLYAEPSPEGLPE
jgi:hypothetical protein